MMASRSDLFQARLRAAGRAAQIKTRHAKGLMQLNNVVGAGIGYKVTGSGPTDEMSVVVAVTRKVSKELLNAADLVPCIIEGVRTDVIETGTLWALGSPMRPARPGCSIAHFESTAGTFGCLVERAGERYILSNNHVLAMLNRARVGDPILQPGPADGGTLADQIATLADFVPIDFGTAQPDCRWTAILETSLNRIAQWSGSSHRLQGVKLTSGENRADAALARPLSPSLVSPDILQVGPPTGTADATLGTRIRKSGRTTGFTTGTVQAIEFTALINYDGPSATFHGQLLATPMSQRGDSGSIVLDEQNRVVGLLFAGSDRATIINPIDAVLDALSATVVTG